jgi:hypothetical protein
VKSRSREEDRKRLLKAGWESRLRGRLTVWRRPDAPRGSWYSQEVAMEILEAEEQDHRDGRA